MSIQRDSYNKTKLNQIVQQFFSKAAQIVIQSRILVTPLYVKGTATPKLNRWFNLELEETETFREDLRLWKSADPQEAVIPPLVVETYLDLRDLSANQTLILIDSKGKSWTVTKGTKRTEIVLERWIIENTEGLKSDQNQELPTIYKYVIILMRSLYTYTRLMPVWNLKNKLSAKPQNTLLNVGCRILNGSHGISSKGRIGLNRRIKDVDSIEVNCFSFDEIPTPLGTLKVTVSYRTECDFFIKNSSIQSLPSNISTSQTDVNSGLNINTNFHLESDSILNMEPSTSYASKNDSKPTIIKRSSVSSLTQGSLPSPSRSSIEGNSYMISRHNVYKNHTKNYSADFTDNVQNFSTQYNTSGDQYLARDRRLSSVSLRDGLISSGGTGSTTIQQNVSGTSPSANVSSQSVSSPIATKPSVSFVQPFKTPSLSASPSSGDITFQSSSTPSSRPQSFSRTTSNSSLAALAALRNPNRTSSNASNTSVGSYIKNAANMHQTYLNENAISSSASSSRSGSVSRYSSSFGSRTGQWNRTGSISGNRPKPLFSGDPSSFGSSTSSVTEPGSGFLMTDDDDLGAFLKTIDAMAYARNNNSSVILQGSGSNNSSLLMSQPRYDANLPGASTNTENSSIGEINLAAGENSDDPLSRFRHLKESHTALSDSMHSSQISRSDVSPLGGSSGQNVAPGSAGSSSASPSQAVFTFAMSPPSIQKTSSSYTPSIPSRLSEQYTPDDSYKVRYNIHPRKHGSRSGSLAIDEEMYIHGDHGNSMSSSKDEQNVSSSARTGALDIPRTHVSRVQRRESLSFSNRHTSGYKDMQDALVLNNSNTHHQSLNTFGQELPGATSTDFRANTTANSPAFSSHRRYSTDVLGSEGHISSFNRPQSHTNSGGSSFANNGNRKISSFISTNSNSNNTSGNDDSSNSTNAGNLHHQLESLPGNFRQQVSLAGGESHIHSHHLGQHHHHIAPSSSSVRSRRFSYYLPDDGDDDDDDGDGDDREQKTSPNAHAAESLPPMDEDVFFFALNDDEENVKGSSSGGITGSGTGGVNTGSGAGSPSGGGRFNHSYDSLAWE